MTIAGWLLLGTALIGLVYVVVTGVQNWDKAGEVRPWPHKETRREREERETAYMSKAQKRRYYRRRR